MSKYQPLWERIKLLDKDELVLSFDEIEKIVNNPLNHTFLSAKKELEDYGYKVSKIFLKERKIKFNRI